MPKNKISKDPKLAALKQAKNTIKRLNLASLGTTRNYTESLKKFAIELNRQNIPLRKATHQTALQYLEDRSVEVGQKQLDMDRQAIEKLLHHNKTLPIDEKLPVLKSEQSEHLKSRAYNPNQVGGIAARQSAKHSVSTRIAHAAGLRAHELATIKPLDIRQPDQRQAHTEMRYKGMEKSIPYTVKGKGGLVREIRLLPDLAAELESRRLEKPQSVTDRGIKYKTHYDIGFGKQWSDSFSKASKRSLGWSNGAHGLRHSYAQNRMRTLQHHCTRDEALTAVSQELGHLRKEITLIYLR